MHSTGPDDVEQFKKRITYGKDTWSDAECILGLKRWLHDGYTMDLGTPRREKHVRHPARKATGLDEAALDAWAASL